MTIHADVIAHSSHEECPDLITLQLYYPRFIHAEVMTHRAFSRNASSSRAVPIGRMIADVEADIAMPVEWGRNQKGMQAGDDIADVDIAKSVWIASAHDAIEHAKIMNRLGLHKQIVNRLLEPFAHISVIVTATDWDNFFKLRLHTDADPTMRELAKAMRKAIEGSKSKHVRHGDWHLPYCDGDETLSSSVAACARVSYLNHDGSKPDPKNDSRLADHLNNNGHLSPFEHQATPTPHKRHANLNGWQSLRYRMENNL